MFRATRQPLSLYRNVALAIQTILSQRFVFTSALRQGRNYSKQGISSQAQRRDFYRRGIVLDNQCEPIHATTFPTEAYRRVVRGLFRNRYGD
ncbi:hypothetical protein GCM10007387_60710 [Pseudoduganella albidiflava]|uniref:Uncharacterized protein n=1 Tax=Pseudoduganella albidiflava TaxID=321983 RepID=A0AA87Y656_9BURK|nr:hypothetical protein GCM10007387_60710 [Pseudoduganella albidiflava]